MRNLATCYNEHAIKVSDSYCSGGGPNKVYRSPCLIPSIQDEVTSLYKVKLSTQKHLFIALTWSTIRIEYAFTITIVEESCSSKSFCMRKIKGSKKLDSGSKIEVVWDLSNALYEMGPGPVKGYYVAVLINSELILFGDIQEDLDWDSNLNLNLKKLAFDYPLAKFSLVSRSERFSGNGEYSTKCKFFETGTWHDITIRCLADDRPGKNSSSLTLWVLIDKKNVIQVKRLRWNFRGNQTIFLDGMLVDMMWDVHDWFFSNGSKSEYRAGIFLFRPRSGLDSRLWLEEKNLGEKEQEKMGSSLLIFACKSPD